MAFEEKISGVNLNPLEIVPSVKNADRKSRKRKRKEDSSEKRRKDTVILSSNQVDNFEPQGNIIVNNTDGESPDQRGEKIDIIIQ